MTQVGQCTLLYNPQREALYSEGVTLECCPTGHGWRLFRELSGGQQAMAALALLRSDSSANPGPRAALVCGVIGVAVHVSE